jgi:hypothetical protein
MKDKTKIACPNCGTEIDVQDILSHQLEEDLQKKFNAKLIEEKKKYLEQEESLKKAREEFEELKKHESDLFEQRLSEKLKKEKEIFSSELKKKLLDEQSEQFDSLQKELNEKSEKLKELNKSKAEIERLKREKDELKESIEAEAQKVLNEKLIEEKEKIRRNEQNKNELTVKELEKKLDDQKKLMDEMQRKHEQGSMQMQGEVQELIIEEWLSNNFPLDIIDEVKKGARGADCLQIVNTRTKQNCGTIYYESKRTKDFQKSWIEKFKEDIREKNADIGVLVTDAMPADMDRVGLKDGIWICTFEEFKGLCFVLRESIIQISNALVTQENKSDKMGMLYDFLTSNEFKLQIEAIVEGFTQMKDDLESEKRAMQRIWKSREKQIEKVVTNTVNMYGSIKGIAGKAIGTVKALELPEGDNSGELF